MPTAPTGMEPSKRDKGLPDEEAAARRSEQRTTKDSPPPGPKGEMAPAGLPKPGNKTVMESSDPSTRGPRSA